MIDLHHVLVRVVRAGDLSLKDVVRLVGQRHVLVENIERCRVESRSGNDVSGKLIAGHRIDDRLGDRREITGSLGRGGHDR